MSTDTYLAHFSISEQDLTNIRTIGEKMLSDLPTMLDTFYAWMKDLPEFSLFFGTEQDVKHVKAMQIKHWQLFFSGNINDDYISFRKKVGAAHAQVGLNLAIYTRSVAAFNDIFLSYFEKHNLQRFDLLASFKKLVDLDVAIVIETYNHITAQTIREQSQALMQLSTPITQLWHGILLLPLIGIVDSRRAQDIMSSMLQKVADTQAKVFILDIGGVAVVDTAVANHLIKITKATRLMGCRTIISGISPAVAQTIVELGVQVEDIMTTNSMQDALKDAFALTNVSIGLV
jgi:rsbT co-antagonist protein RsbR